MDSISTTSNYSKFLIHPPSKFESYTPNAPGTGSSGNPNNDILSVKECICAVRETTEDN